MRFRPLTVAALLASLLAVACGITTPSDNTVDPVSGTIPVGGSDTHSYTFKRNGEVEVRITSVTPTPSASLGMGLGQTANGVCTLLAGYVSALVVNRTAQFGYLNKGDYCLIVYDTGVLTVPTNYSGTVSHP